MLEQTLETETKQILNSLPLSEICHKMRSKIVIDAGHTPLLYSNGDIKYGRAGTGPSRSEVKTLAIAVLLAEKLKASGKEIIINICFSDVSKNIESMSNRVKIKEIVKEDNFLERLPQEYKALIPRLKALNIKISLTLQTMNSNLFSQKLKAAKKLIRAKTTSSEVYEAFNALFTAKKSSAVFGLVSPYLLDTSIENSGLGGDWWQDESMEIHPADKILYPLLAIKKKGLINLHSKHDGILCPGTYMGLMLSYDKAYDFIAIYSREDDPEIGEKINSAAIAAYHLDATYHRSSLQLVLPESLPGVEQTLLKSDQVRANETPSFEELVKRLNTHPHLCKKEILHDLL